MGEALEERVPPHSTEAEQAVLGAVLMDNAQHPAVAAKLTAPDMWYHAAHRWVWVAACDLIVKGQPADIVTVHELLAARGQAEAAGGMRYLNDVAMAAAGTASAVAYADIVAERALARRVMAAAQALIDSMRGAAAEPGGVMRVLDAGVAKLLDLQQGRANGGEPRLLAGMLPGWIDALQLRADGVTDALPTGLSEVDRILGGGLRRGELVVIGGRPSMGKSALVLTLARGMSAHCPVLACSLEDSDLMLVSRMVAAAGRVNLADIRQPDRAGAAMWDGVTDGVELLRPLRLWLDDAPDMGVADIERRVQWVRGQAGDCAVVLVDYAQLMDGQGETRAAALAEIARGLKRMAKRQRCAVVLLSQLNRKADESKGPPGLEHLAESDGMEQAADVIGLLWREARKNPKPDNMNLAQVEFAKVKNGATDTAYLYFDGKTQRMADLVGDGYGQ